MAANTNCSVCWLFLAMSVDVLALLRDVGSRYTNRGRKLIGGHQVLTESSIMEPLATIQTHFFARWNKLLRNKQAARLTFMREARRIELLLNEYGQMFGRSIFYGEVVQVFIVIFSSYASVRSSGVSSLRSLTVAVALSWVGQQWLGKLADVYEGSRITLESWKDAGNLHDRLFRRFLKATKPMRVNVGGFFYADRMLVLTVGGIMLQNTASLLITV